MAAALTTAELPSMAMIGRLYATPSRSDHRHLKAAVAALLQSLFNENKQALVLTRDPLIDTILDRFGFEDIGPWRTVYLAMNQRRNSVPRAKQEANL